MRILVTGFTGFVGTHLTRYLLQHDHEVFGMAQHPANDSPVAPDHQFLRELASAPDLADLLQSMQPEAIVHLAGQASAGASWADPEGTLRSNVDGTLALVRALEGCSSVQRWINAGSAEEYAIPPDQHPLTEEDPLVPSNPYGVSKVSQEWLLQQLLPRQQVALIQFRVFNLTGPGQSERFVLGSFARQLARIAQGQQAPVLHTGDLSKVRDFLDVRDACIAYAAAAAGDLTPGVYNLCSGHPSALQALVEAMVALTGVRVQVVPDPERLRPGDVAYLVGDPTRLQIALQGAWHPRDMATTMRELYEDAQDHRA